MQRNQIFEQIVGKRTFLCVGLDTDRAKMPQVDFGDGNAMFEFNKRIIEATAPYCIAYKPNVAFYECAGAEGWEALRLTCDYLRCNYPEHLIIADAKRGDIGNTSKMYASAFYDDLKADAVTVAPYMGKDSVTPFLDYEGKWVVLLDLTSNPGSHDFQLTLDEKGEPLYKKVLRISQEWAGADKMMYVVGATQGRMFEEIRKVAPESFLLVPGVGAQGGSLEEVCRYGMNSQCGLIVNSSRGIIYASKGEDFAEAAAREARKLRDEMDRQLKIKGL